MRKERETAEDRHFDPFLSGVVRRYLQEGEHEGRLVFIEVERSSIVAVIDAVMGIELPVDCVSQNDFESTLNELNTR